MEVWREHLSDKRADLATDAVRTLEQVSKWFPTIAEFMESYEYEIREDRRQRANELSYPRDDGPWRPAVADMPMFHELFEALREQLREVSRNKPKSDPPSAIRGSFDPLEKPLAYSEVYPDDPHPGVGEKADAHGD